MQICPLSYLRTYYFVSVKSGQLFDWLQFMLDNFYSEHWWFPAPSSTGWTLIWIGKLHIDLNQLLILVKLQTLLANHFPQNEFNVAILENCKTRVNWNIAQMSFSCIFFIGRKSIMEIFSLGYWLDLYDRSFLVLFETAKVKTALIKKSCNGEELKIEIFNLKVSDLIVVTRGVAFLKFKKIHTVYVEATLQFGQ